MRLLATLYANRWVRYLLSALLLAAVILKVHPQHLSQALLAVQPDSLVFALALTIPFLALKAWRWHAMLRAAGVRAGWSEALISLLGGMGLALVTPARLGELVRVAYLRDGQKWKIGGLVLLDKAFDVLVLCTLSIVGAWALIGPAAGIAFAALTAAGFVAVYSPRDVMSLFMRPAAHLPFRDKLSQVLTSLTALSASATTGFLVLTLAAFGIVLVQFAIVLSNWHTSSLAIVALTFPLVILTNILPITIGGLGVREAAAALLLARYGVPSADAALAAFLMFAINTALPGIVGAFLLPAPRSAKGVEVAASYDGL